VRSFMMNSLSDSHSLEWSVLYRKTISSFNPSPTVFPSTPRSELDSPPLQLTSSPVAKTRVLKSIEKPDVPPHSEAKQAQRAST
jgi:hypothetical protein